jgi:hypothetical protein
MAALGHDMAFHGLAGGFKEQIGQIGGLTGIKAGESFKHNGEGRSFVAGHVNAMHLEYSFQKNLQEFTPH